MLPPPNISQLHFARKWERGQNMKENGRKGPDRRSLECERSKLILQVRGIKKKKVLLK
jgi:hypothetical protein